VTQHEIQGECDLVKTTSGLLFEQFSGVGDRLEGRRHETTAFKRFRVMEAAGEVIIMIPGGAS
jgi:hypothetical protein